MDPVNLTDKQVAEIGFAVLRFHNDDRLWRALTYNSGPYEVTTPSLALRDLAAAFFVAGIAAAQSAPAPQAQPLTEVRWIPVSERLPEKFVEVIVAFKETSLPSTGQYTASEHDHDGWCFPSENRDWSTLEWPTVTHWMPLPDHPNEAAFQRKE